MNDIVNRLLDKIEELNFKIIDLEQENENQKKEMMLFKKFLNDNLIKIVRIDEYRLAEDEVNE